MSDGMRRELMYLSSYATNRYFIPNWGIFVSENQQFVKELTEVTMNSLVALLLGHPSVIRNQHGLSSVIRNQQGPRL